MEETPYLNWYQRHICEIERHNHDAEDGLLSCLINRLATIQNTPGPHRLQTAAGPPMRGFQAHGTRNVRG